MNAKVEALWVASRGDLLKSHPGRVAVFSEDGLVGVADDIDGAVELGVGRLRSLDFELRTIRNERVIEMPLCLAVK